MKKTILVVLKKKDTKSRAGVGNIGGDVYTELFASKR